MKQYPTHLIVAAKSKEDKVFFENGNTKDIISVVLNADKFCADYTKKFAYSLRGKSVLETCSNVWEFVKTQIPYQLDPHGYQFIKSPGRLWADKSGDCKSFSVFCASILKNLGIEYGYRFTSYDPNDPTPTHVYIFVPLAAVPPPGAEGAEIIIDAVWNGPFNTQKTYTHKEDHLMPKIVYLGSTGTMAGIPASPHNPHRGMLKLTKPVDEITEEELTLLLARQKLEIDQDNARRVGGTWKVEGYQRSLDMVNHVIANMENPNVINGLADSFLGSTEIGKLKIGKFLKNVGTGIKKGTKAVAKVVTTPLRLIGKGIIEIYLPKAAPAFLYLFVAESVVTILPDKMKRKREKAVKFKNFVCNKLGMKDAHFMGIIRNNLTKRFQQSPEAFLAAELKRVGISGIGNPNAKKMKKKIVNKKEANRPAPNTTLVSAFAQPGKLTKILPGTAQPNIPITTVEQREQLFNAERKKLNLVATFSKAASGNILGAVMDAIGWIISKLGGKKADVDFGADDIPDVVADAANAFEYKNLQNDYSNITPYQQEQVKDTVTELIEKDANTATAYRELGQYNYLTELQKQEMVKEVQSGFIPATEEETNDLALRIKQTANEDYENNGGGTVGWCNC